MKQGHEEFLVKWKGTPDYNATWEPQAHLMNVHETLEDFEHGIRNAGRINNIEELGCFGGLTEEVPESDLNAEGITLGSGHFWRESDVTD